MSQLIVKKLLESQLNTTPGLLPTAFENSKREVTVSSPFQEVHLLWAKTQNPTFGDGFKREAGIFQVTLSYPLKAGAQPALIMAEAIKTVFPRGLSLTEGKVTVKIDESPHAGKGFIADGWYTVPVSVPFIGDVMP